MTRSAGSSRERFRRQPHARARGDVGEDEAWRWLEHRGYRLVERNVTCRGGEIDVVAFDEGDAGGEKEPVLCFVEIKARASRSHGRAVESITPTKQRRIVRAARWYLTRNPTDAPCRFDVLAMDLEGGRWRFTLVRDAFPAEG